MSNKKKIAIIGASYLQLPAVLKAQQLGLEVHCFAWRDGAVCADIADFFYPISITDKDGILQVCRQVGIDGVVTIASDLAVHTVNYVAHHMHLVANPYEYTLATTDKYKMRECFAANGIPSPKYVCLSAQPSADDVAHLSALEYPLIVKPTDRSGSRGVEKVYDHDQLQTAVSRAIGESFAGACVVEEFVEGREVSVESISYNGQHHVLQITDKVTTEAPYFVETEHHQPSTLPAATQQLIRQWVVKALDALHILYGASHSEIKVCADGSIRFIEVGARMGGDFIGSDLVELSTGYDFLGATIKCALGVFDEPHITTQAYSGVYFLCKGTERILPYIENWQSYPQIKEAKITDSVLREIQCSADRSGYLIYCSHSPFSI